MPQHKSLLSGVKAGQPALTRAMELQRKASTVGFDWNDPRAVIAKIREEIDELEAELDAADAAPAAATRGSAAPSPALAARQEEELGNVLFAVANLARHLAIDPEKALRGTNDKFRRRFAHIERRLAEAGRTPAEATLDEMEALLVEAKGK